MIRFGNERHDVRQRWRATLYIQEQSQLPEAEPA